MRCKNCHTVMMDTDTHCPGCRSPVARATADAPGAIPDKPNGLLMALPIFGGAIGGLAYAALTANQNSHVPSYGSAVPATEASGPSPLRRWIGVVFIALGGLFVMLACVNVFSTWEIAHRDAKAVTAADLSRQDFAKSAPSWMAYTFAESKPTSISVTRRRLSAGGDIDARCLLVRVQDQWLVATVARGFEGDTLVGRILPVDSPASKTLIERVRTQDSLTVLPYEFNAVDGSASDQRLRYLAGAWIGGFGLLALMLGLWLCRGKRQPAQPAAEPADANWAYQPLPKS